jgi:hypothetical protein
MNFKKVTSILALALVVTTGSSFLGQSAYATEISSNVVNVKTTTQATSKSEMLKIIKIVDSNISYTSGHYSFNKDNAIKLGVSSDKVSSVETAINILNKELDDGTIKVSSDGKKITSTNTSKTDSSETIHLDSSDMGGGSGGGGDQTLVYAKYLDSDTCADIGDYLGIGAGVATIAGFLMMVLPNPDKLTAIIIGVAGGVMTIGAVAFNRASRKGGTTFCVYALEDSGKFARCFLR